MNQAMKLCDVAIKTITLIKFYENYMSKSGRLSWETYKEQLEEAPTTSPRHSKTNSSAL